MSDRSPTKREPYDQQLHAKRHRVEFAFGRHDALAAIAIPGVRAASPTEGYRTRAKLVVAGDAVGLYAPGTHDVVDLEDGTQLAPAVKRAVDAIRACVKRRTHPALTSTQHGGALTGIDVREVLDDDASTMVTLVLLDSHGLPEAALREAAALLNAEGAGIRSLAVSVVREKSVQMLGTGHRVIAGPSVVRDRIGLGDTFQLAAHGSFIQAHRETTRAIHEQLVAEVYGSRRVLELFSGSGALGLSLAKRDFSVFAVESYSPAVEHANEAAQLQHLDGYHAVSDDAERATLRLAEDGERFDAVVVNPPRRGLTPRLRAAIVELSPRGIAYISCEPETLARDLSDLRRMGYVAENLRPFDMMPHTREVETLAWLVRAKPLTPKVVYEDDTVLVVEKMPHEPTLPQAEHGSSLLARVRRLPNAERAVAVHRLDPDTSGLCLFVRDENDAEPWRRALLAESATRLFTGLVQGEVSKRTLKKPLADRGGPPKAATTNVERIERAERHSLVRIEALEERTHQARRHLAMVRHPVLGDARYGHAPTNKHFFEKHGLDRAFLHASRIALAHPFTGAALEFESVLPGDLQSVLASLTHVA